MLQATPQLQEDLDTRLASASAALPIPPKEIAPGHGLGAQKLKNAVPAPPRTFAQPKIVENQRQHTRIPAILGEATFRGNILVEGMISGQPGTSGGSTTFRQHSRAFLGAGPELNGEITFVDMIRVNGHIAGSVHSQKGTLIVDTSARVDASVNVAIAVISGTVTGDITAHERVELAPSAKIYGNIFTRSLAIQSGAIFEGICQMLEDKPDA
jgi:cytoskeletal protein CcmA (bactofilin family)